MGRPVLSRRATLASAALLAGLAGACLRGTSYTCETDGECAVGGAGTCEDVGYCSFPDPACDSGRRFGEGAGPYAEQCVADSGDGGTDAVTLDARPVDARGDGGPGPDAATTVGCTQPGNGTSFTGGFACQGWGAVFRSNATVENVNGRLVVTPAANMVTFGGCTRGAVPFAAPGVLAEVERVVDGARGRTRLELAGTGVSLGVEGGMLVARAADQPVAMAPYAAGPMRWWRVRPVAGQLVYETSPDGDLWTRFAMAGTAPPAMAPIRVVGETTSGEPAPGSARFASVNVCP